MSVFGQLCWLAAGCPLALHPLCSWTWRRTNWLLTKPAQLPDVLQLERPTGAAVCDRRQPAYIPCTRTVGRNASPATPGILPEHCADRMWTPWAASICLESSVGGFECLKSSCEAGDAKTSRAPAFQGCSDKRHGMRGQTGSGGGPTMQQMCDGQPHRWLEWGKFCLRLSVRC